METTLNPTININSNYNKMDLTIDYPDYLLEIAIHALREATIQEGKKLLAHIRVQKRRGLIFSGAVNIINRIAVQNLSILEQMVLGNPEFSIMEPNERLEEDVLEGLS